MLYKTHISSWLVGLVWHSVGLVRDMWTPSRILQHDAANLVNTQGEGLWGTWKGGGVGVGGGGVGGGRGRGGGGGGGKCHSFCDVTT